MMLISAMFRYLIDWRMYATILVCIISNPALSQSESASDNNYQFIKSIKDINVPEGCHAQLYKRSISTIGRGPKLIPYDYVNYADIVCIGERIEISESIFTNGGDIRIFAHDIVVKRGAIMDTRIYLQKSMSYINLLSEFRSEYLRRNTNSFLHFLPNQYSEEYLVSIQNYYEACMDCMLRRDQVFSPRLPDGLLTVQDYGPSEETLFSDIESAEASIIQGNLKSGSVFMYLSGSLVVPDFSSIEMSGYQVAVRTSGERPAVPDNPVFKEHTRFIPIRVDAMYPSRPWLIGLPTCGYETRFYSMQGAVVGCRENSFSLSGRAVPTSLSTEPGHLHIQFTDFGQREVTARTLRENMKDPYALKLQGRPVFGEADAFRSMFTFPPQRLIPWDYQPKIGPEVIRVRSGHPCCDKDPVFKNGAPGPLLVGDPASDQPFEADVNLLDVKHVNSIDVLLSNFLSNVLDRHLERLLSGDLPRINSPANEETSTLDGGYILSDIDFISLQLNTASRNIIKTIVQSEVNVYSGANSLAVRAVRPFEKIESLKVVDGGHGLQKSLEYISRVNAIRSQVMERNSGGIFEAMAHSSNGLLNYMSFKPRVSWEYFSQTWLSLEGLRATRGIEGQISALREEQLHLYEVLTRYITAQMEQQIRERITNLDKALREAEKGSDVLSVVANLPAIVKSANSSASGTSKFLSTVGIEASSAYIAAAIIAVNVYREYGKYKDAIERSSSLEGMRDSLLNDLARVSDEGRSLTRYFRSRKLDISYRDNEKVLSEALVILDTQEVEYILSALGRLALNAGFHPKNINKNSYLEYLSDFIEYFDNKEFSVSNSVNLPLSILEMNSVDDDWECRNDRCICKTAEEGNLTGDLYISLSIFGAVHDLKLIHIEDVRQFCFHDFGFDERQYHVR